MGNVASRGGGSMDARNLHAVHAAVGNSVLIQGWGKSMGREAALILAAHLIVAADATDLQIAQALQEVKALK